MRLSLGDIFALPTVQGQAALIEHGVQSLAPPIAPIPDADDYPVVPAQQRLWLASRTPEGSRALHMSARFRLHGPLLRAPFAEAVAQLLARHETLRTTFRMRAGRLRQQVRAALPVDAVCTWHDAPPADVQALIDAPFSLGSGPLLRLHVWAESPTTHHMVGVLHHIVGDAVSLRVLFDDLLEAYLASRDQRAPAWEALAVQGRDIAAWQLAQARATGAADEAFWRRVLQPVPAPLSLPGAESPEATAHVRTLILDDRTVATMRALARTHGTTLFAVLTTAVGGLLHRVTGRQDLVIGTQLSRRAHPSLQRQVGLLIDSVPLPFAVMPGDRSEALLRRVTRSVREALTHGAIGFDRLLDLLDVQVTGERTPLFDVVVQYIQTGDDRDAPPERAGALVAENLETETASAPYTLTVEGSDGPGGTMVVQLTASARLSTEFVALFVARLPDVVAWLTAADESPLSSLPMAAVPRPRRTRISLDLS
jgi:non-ribosomal peptide synthetase component F